MTAIDPWHDVPHVVVLCNFGGPTKADEVEPFLRKLFEDPFIIRSAMLPDRMRRWIAKRISTKRAPKATHEYEAIGYSPINRMTDIQAKHLERLLRERRPNTRVIVANRYTQPDADKALASFDPKACRLFLITLYPHLCHSTTVSSLRDFDLAMERSLGHRDVPSTRVFTWWQTPRYLELSFARLKDGLQKVLERDGPISIVYSAHGIPTRYHLRGDPYVNEISAHVAELTRRAKTWLAGIEGGKHLSRCHWQLSFQSRVGPVEWVKPYTDVTVEELGKSRGGAVLMVPISFTSDHIETLFEMDQTYKNLALKSGFKQYERVVPANDDPELAASLRDAIVNHGF